MKKRVRSEEVSEFSRPPVLDMDGVQHECGGQFRLAVADREVVVGQSRRVVRQELYRCDSCEEEMLTYRQIDDARRLATALMRADEQLLSGNEIRELRERLGLTQHQLEQALGLGEKTVVRWETERVIVPKATDNLLRLLDRDPSALGFLAKRHGVTLPAAAHDANRHALQLVADQPGPVQRDATRENQIAGTRSRTDAMEAELVRGRAILRKAPHREFRNRRVTVGVGGGSIRGGAYACAS